MEGAVWIEHGEYGVYEWSDGGRWRAKMCVCMSCEVWNNTCSMHNADCIMHHLEHGM